MSKYPIVFGGAMTLAVALVSCGGNKGLEQNAPPPVPVAVTTVLSQNVAYYDEYPASVAALNQVDLRPEVSGYITEIDFKDGQHVREGMRLYSIDQQQYKAMYDQAIANLNVAKANLAKSQQDADRYTDLAKNDAVARQTLEHALADLQAAKMQVVAVEANVENVQTNVRYSVIRAPFDGTIGISFVKMGSSVTAGQTLLNTVSSDNPMAVDCSVDEKQIGQFADLLKHRPASKDSMFTIVLPNQAIYPSVGKLSLIDRAVDPQTGTIRIRTIFPNPQNVLRAGLTCDLRIRNVNARTAVLIPYAAVTEQMGEYFVFVLNGNRVTQRRINLGMIVDHRVIVKNGLQAGEQIVTEGVQKLRENSLVAVVPSAANGPAQVAQGK